MKAKEPKFKLGPIQRAWVKALRSGKYKQTKNVLTRTTVDGAIVGHCCLGVLCDLALKHKVTKSAAEIHSRRDQEIPCIAYSQEDSGLPVKVRQWAGVRDAYGDFDAEQENLAGMNDTGATFAEIADIIEANAKQMFTRSK